MEEVRNEKDRHVKQAQPGQDNQKGHGGQSGKSDKDQGTRPRPEPGERTTRR